VRTSHTDEQPAGGPGGGPFDFSIVTPSLNQGAYLADCLASVREAAARSGRRVEHFVADGGSSDRTPDILRNQTFARWISGPDGGQTDAINLGIARTSGDIVSYLCADDLLEPDALARVWGAFAANPDAGVVYGDAYFLEGTWKRPKTAGEFSVARLRAGNFLFQPAVFLRRAVLDAHGPFDVTLRYCMDHEYWLRVAESARWVSAGVPLACCRLHADAKTWTSLPAAWDEARRMQLRYGIRWRPLRDAIWMRLLGCHYYRLKRLVFARLARLRGRGET